MATIIAYAQFIASKSGKDGIVVTWDIEQITRSDGTRAALVTGGATNVIIGRRGLYGYRLTGADLTLYDYVFTAITADGTVDQQELAAMWTLWSLSWHDIATSIMTVVGSIGKLFTDYIDAAISSRSTLTQADILSDATPFAGANIDQAISDPVTVGNMETAALAQFANTDTGEVAAVAGSVAELSQCNSAGFPAGAITFEYTVTSSVTGLPLDNVAVWISTDNPADGNPTNVIWSGFTDVFGVARDALGNEPMLDAGTYYFWRSAPGISFTNPDTEIVSNP